MLKILQGLFNSLKTNVYIEWMLFAHWARIKWFYAVAKFNQIRDWWSK